MSDYRSLNRANWDERAPAHAASPGYAVERFLSDPGFISDVVRFDLPRLGDVSGLKGAHLQCHIGTDTLSLARLGARMKGLDFSAASIEQARSLAERTGTNIEYVVADVYDAPGHLGRAAFDLVFTGIGALCWLPDVARWAQVVSELLRPGGRLFIRDGHPMLWSLAEPQPDAGQLVIDNPYFERAEPMIWDDPGTYVDTDAAFTQNVTHEWNHGLGEIVSALLDCGLALTMLAEHDSVPWEALPGVMRCLDGNEWQLADRPWRLAHTFTLQAVKPA